MKAQLWRFLLAPARATPFAALRIGLAAALLVQALQVAPMFLGFYHHGGLLRGPLMDAFATGHVPALGRLVPAQRIESEGRADQEPIAANDSAAGRARNRRVEITLFTGQ